MSDELTSPPPGAPPPGALRRALDLLRQRSVRERLLAPVAFDGLILSLNMVTGIIVARALGPSGRGELAIVLMLAQMGAWLFSLGATEGVAFRLSRHPEDGGRLLGSWLALSIPLSLLAIAIGELLVPILFAAQTDNAIHLAQIYLAVVSLLVIQAILNGILLGDQDFRLYLVIRLIPPLLLATSYVVLWASGNLSVEFALAVNAAAAAAGVIVAAVRALSRHGLGPPDLPLLRGSLWYGIRAHGGSIAGLVNTRLDIIIIPAFLSAASVGLYSVATNVTSIIATLTGTVALLAMPVAARRQKGSARTIVRTLHATLAIGLVIAIPLELLADFALSLIYGSEFGAAATALRILLPGSVLDAGAVVLWSGLMAANRPFLSSAAAGPAALLTIVGLVLFLESGGITAAAIVTSVAFSLVFVISIVLYRRVAGLRWIDFIRVPAQ